MPRTAFGNALAKLRTRAKISQSKLAKRANYDHTYVSRLESGSRMPSREAVDNFARALKLTREETRELAHAAGFVMGGDPILERFTKLERLYTASSQSKRAAIDAMLRFLNQYLGEETE